MHITKVKKLEEYSRKKQTLTCLIELLSVPSMVSYFDVENHPYSMHNKLFAFDEVIAIIGSYNPTGSSTINNDD